MMSEKIKKNVSKKYARENNAALIMPTENFAIENFGIYENENSENFFRFMK